MNRVPPKSRRWTPQIVERVEQPRPAGDVSSHLGGQFGFAYSRAAGSRSVRGYPREVKL